MRILVDTSVAVFAIPYGRAGSTPEAHAADAEQLFARGHEHVFLLATPTLAELLVRVPAEKRRDVASILGSIFTIVEFDRLAAVEAAALLVRPLPPGQRNIVRFDLQIVACGVRAGADGLCTTDDDQIRIGATRMKAGYPSTFLTGVQPPLFHRRV